VVFNVFILNESMVANSSDGRSRRCRARDHFHFDWEQVSQDAAKFKAIPCPKEADRVFLYKAIAASQDGIPPFALWDALEAVKRIGPQTPIAYFRTVLRDNCRKADVDLEAALRAVHLPRPAPWEQADAKSQTPKGAQLGQNVAVTPHGMEKTGVDDSGLLC
jgi:hypothetical protein